MAKRVLDIDPINGIITYHDYDHLTGVTTIQRTQNIEPYLQRSQERKNDDDYTKNGIKKSWWHYADIPNLVIEQWKKEGVDIFDKNCRKEVIKRLNGEWKHLKNTRKFHRLK